MRELSPRNAAVASPPAHEGQRRRLPPGELHKQRVEWGKKWGKMVSEEVARQLRERG